MSCAQASRRLTFRNLIWINPPEALPSFTLTIRVAIRIRHSGYGYPWTTSPVLMATSCSRVPLPEYLSHYPPRAACGFIARRISGLFTKGNSQRYTLHLTARHRIWLLMDLLSPNLLLPVPLMARSRRSFLNPKSSKPVPHNRQYRPECGNQIISSENKSYV